MLLREGLDLSSTGALRRMASVHGLLHDDATTRDELIERLADRLLDSTYLEEQLDRLEDDERATLIDARASGGELRGLLVERDHPGAGEALIERGLLFRIFAAAGPLRGEVFEVPQEILALLPEPPPVDAPPPDAAPPAERRASDPAFSLFALVSALSRDGSNGANLEADVRDWSEEPGGWEWEARWTFLGHLAQTAGLIVHQADGALAPGPALSRLLDDPPALSDRLWRSYLQDRGWSELERGRASADRAQEIADAVLLRRALIDAVRALPEGTWVGLDAFSDWLRGAHAVVVREQLNARGVVLMDSASWADLEHPLLRYTLLGPLYWLGVIGASADGQHIVRRPGAPPLDRPQPPPRTVGPPTEEGGLPARVTAQPGLEGGPPGRVTVQPGLEGGVMPGRATARPGLEGGPPGRVTVQPGLEGGPPGRVTVQPGLEGGVMPGRATARRVAAEACVWEGASELVAPTRTRLGTLLDAERYLVLLERGRPSRYHLVQSHVAAALGSGGSIGECRRLLRKLSQGPLPDAVEDKLAAWESRFGALGVRPAVLLEAGTEAELDEAIADERVRPFVRARLGPLVAEVAAADVLELAAALRKGGHLPRVDAALRLAAAPRRAYAGLIDEQVLEFLLVGLLAFERARPEYLGELEGSTSLLERLERQFPPERLSQLRAAAARMAGELGPGRPGRRQPTSRRRRKRT